MIHTRITLEPRHSFTMLYENLPTETPALIVKAPHSHLESLKRLV